VRYLALLFGGDAQFGFSLVFHTVAQHAQYLVRGFARGANDEDKSEALLVKPVRLAQLTHGVMRGVTRGLLLFLRPAVFAAFTDARVDLERLQPIGRGETPPYAVRGGEHFFRIGKGMRGHLTSPTHGAAALQQIGLGDLDHPQQSDVLPRFSNFSLWHPACVILGCSPRLPAFVLDPVEVRVLASLLEKESTTPEYYPLTLNSLVTACNQKSNRSPVVSYDDDTVAQALDRLRARKLSSVIISGGRAQKYAQRISETLNLGRRELALLCTLMLRGQQTLGESRDRSDRIHHFDDVEQAELCLQHLIELELAVKLPRQPGQKESRYAHLLSGPVQAEESVEPEYERAPGRLSALEKEVAELRDQVRVLQQQIAQFL
jgi:uncharacterized protein